MIITFLLTAFLAAMMGLFGALPNIPPIPESIETASESVISFVGQGTSVLAVIFSPALLTASVVVILAMFFFSQVYHTTMWVVKKIPFINIK